MQIKPKPIQTNNNQQRQVMLPLLKSQSLGILDSKGQKNAITQSQRYHKKYHENQRQKLDEQMFSIEFNLVKDHHPKKSIVQLQIDEKSQLKEELKKLNNKMRQKKLQQSYNTIDLWKSKYSLEMRIQRENAKSHLSKFNEERTIQLKKPQKQFLQRQKRKQKNIQLQIQNSLLNEEKKSNFNQPQLSAYLKNSLHKKQKLMPNILEFQVKKAQYSKLKAKKKVEISSSKQPQPKKKVEPIIQTKKIEKVEKPIEYFKQGQPITKWETNQKLYEDEDEGAIEFEHSSLPDSKKMLIVFD